jgi:hypothetical protein
MSALRLPSGARLVLLAVVVGLAGQAAAHIHTDPHAAAIKACTGAKSLEPASFVTAVDDGRGGSLVWLTDEDANLWLCNADKDGHIFVYNQMAGDLLEGAGAALVDIGHATNDGGIEAPDRDPEIVAAQACQMYLADVPGKVVGSGFDGLEGDWVPGYYVLMETGEGLFLCDATGDAQVWAFAEIGDPLAVGDVIG